MSFQGSKDKCFPAQSEIVERCGLKERSVRYTLSELSKKGWISVKRRGKKLSNLYECLPRPEVIGSDHCRSLSEGDRHNACLSDRQSLVPVHIKRPLKRPKDDGVSALGGPPLRTKEEEEEIQRILDAVPWRRSNMAPS